MAKKKKQFKDYQDYLASPEWKALKEEFYAQYDGLGNICEISLFNITGTPHLHHWKYPKNWNNDSIDNLIMVDSEVHTFIHSIDKINTESKKEYIQSAQITWLTNQYTRNSNINKKEISSSEINLLRVLGELLYQRDIRITSDIIFGDDSVEVNRYFVNGIMLDLKMSEYIKGYCKQINQSRNKYGIDYDVNFRLKELDNG